MLNTQIYNLIKNYIIINNLDAQVLNNLERLSYDLYLPQHIVHDIIDRIISMPERPFNNVFMLDVNVPYEVIRRYNHPHTVVDDTREDLSEAEPSEAEPIPTRLEAESVRGPWSYDIIDWDLASKISEKDTKKDTKKVKAEPKERFKLILGQKFKDLTKTLGHLNSVSDVFNHMSNNNGEWPIKTLDILDAEMVEYTEPKSDKKLQARVGRVIGRLMDHLQMRNDSYIEQYSNAYKAIYQINNNIIDLEIVKGDDIVKYYHENNQVNRGTLGSSCMRHTECMEYIKFYKIDCISLVV